MKTLNEYFSGSNPGLMFSTGIVAIFRMLFIAPMRHGRSDRRCRPEVGNHPRICRAPQPAYASLKVSDRLLLGSPVGDLSLPFPQLHIGFIDVLLCDFDAVGADA